MRHDLTRSRRVLLELKQQEISKLQARIDSLTKEVAIEREALTRGCVHRFKQCETGYNGVTSCEICGATREYARMLLSS